MNIGIIINRDLTKEEISGIQLLLQKNPQAVIYTNQELPDVLLTGKVVPYELTPKEKSEINYEIMDRVLAFGEITINDKTITDYLTFNNASIWHYHKFRVYFDVRNYIYEQTLVDHISNNYEQIYYYGEREILSNKLKLKNKIINLIKQAKRDNKSKLSLFKYAAFFAFRIIIGLFYQNNLKGKKYLLIDHARKQICLDIKSLKLKKDNYNLGYLFDATDDEFAILDEVEVVKLSSVAHGLFNKSNFFKTRKGKYFFNEPIILRQLFSGNAIRKNKDYSAHLKQIYKLIRNQISDPVDQLILENLISFHKSSLYYLFKYDAYKKFFEKHSFQSVSSIDENSPRIKIILDAAKRNHIKTIGIQHGTIHRLHPAYLFTQTDIKRNIIADHTLVWGEYWKNFLMDVGNYPESSLHITGQVRTDIIPKILNHNEVGNSFVRHTQNKKVILFASQPQRDAELRKLAAFDVFTVAKKTENSYLIFKLHPAEENDFLYYDKIAKEAGCSNYSIIYEADLYILIGSADVVITCFSTVGAETTYFSKPLIILDHLKQDIQQYHREGIAFQAVNNEELTMIIHKIFKGEYILNKDAYKKYINKFAYKIDGKASERICSFIKAI